MTVWKIDPSDDLVKKHSTLFGSGAFVVADREPSSPCGREKINRKKNLFIVAPKYHPDHDVLSADHFSFLVNKVDPKASLHFHRTTYVPGPDTLDGRTGRVYRVKNHLPEKFAFVGQNKIRVDGDSRDHDFLKNGQLDRVMPAVRDMFTRHIRNPAERRVECTSSTGGGRWRRRKSRRNKFNSINLTDAFRTLPIRRILVVGVRARPDDARDFDVLVVFADRLNQEATKKASMEFAFVLKMSGDDLADDERLEMEIAACVRGKTWADFCDLG
jgi:hypothetical protein